MARKENSFWKFVGASALGYFLVSIASALFSVVMYAAIIGNMFTSSEIKVEDNSILYIDLKQGLPDKNTGVDLQSLSFETKEGLPILLNAVKKAKNDDQIKALLLELNTGMTGMANLKEFRDVLVDFKESGKPIYAYSSVYTQAEYYLASVADSVYLVPTGMVEWKGLGSEIPYMKGLFDKLDVEMQIIRGTGNDFKSAVEPYFLEEMSDSNRMQIEAYLGSMWSVICQEVGEARGISVAKLNEIADNFDIRSGETAVEHGFVDELVFKDQLIAKLKSFTGTEEDDDINSIGLIKYAKATKKFEVDLDEEEGKNIAVILAEGDIVMGDKAKGSITSDRLSREIRKARKDEDIDAIVLRVNSPGGSALASDIIWREVVLAKEVKPVIVSMGNLAASGGYYIACAADTIVAQPNTITGSIGVFGMVPYTGKMFKEKLGINFSTVQTNKHSVLSMNKKLTEEEYNMIQASVDQIYADFVTKVAEGRSMDVERVKELAKGRVYTGVTAMELGLVDVLGGLNTAIDIAGDMIGDSTANVTYYPKKDLKGLELFLDQLGNAQISNVNLGPNVPKEYAQILDILNRIDRMQGVQARLPFEIEFK